MDMHDNFAKKDKKILKILSCLDVFKTLNKEELCLTSSLTQIKKISAGTILFREGDESKEIYFILKGEINIIKKAERKNFQYPIKKLYKNEMFGDMAFYDNSFRSGMAQAITESNLLCINPEHFKDNQAILNKITLEIAKLSFRRLRSTNELYIHALQKQLDETSLRNEFGKFFLIIFLIFGIGNVIDVLSIDFSIDTKSNLYNWSYLFFVCLPIFYFIKKFNYSLSTFGITTYNFKSSFIHSIYISIASVIFCFIAFFIYGILYDNSLLKSLLELNDSRVMTPMILIYYPHAYIQEFIARGVIQTSLRRFFNDESGVNSVILTSMLFGIFHLHLGIFSGLLTFIGSLFFGWIYNKDRNLIGVSIAHFSLGVFLIHLGFL